MAPSAAPTQAAAPNASQELPSLPIHLHLQLKHLPTHLPTHLQKHLPAHLPASGACTDRGEPWQQVFSPGGGTCQGHHHLPNLGAPWEADGGRLAYHAWRGPDPSAAGARRNNRSPRDHSSSVVGPPQAPGTASKAPGAQGREARRQSQVPLPAQVPVSPPEGPPQPPAYPSCAGALPAMHPLRATPSDSSSCPSYPAAVAASGAPEAACGEPDTWDLESVGETDGAMEVEGNAWGGAAEGCDTWGLPAEGFDTWGGAAEGEFDTCQEETCMGPGCPCEECEGSPGGDAEGAEWEASLVAAEELMPRWLEAALRHLDGGAQC